MWHQKQNNEIYPGQVMSPNLGSQAPRVGNIKVQDTSGVSDRDFMAESLRKRKAVAVDQPGNDTSGVISESVLGNRWPSESYQQPKVGMLSSMNGQCNTMRVFSNQTPAESGIKVFQSGRFQFQGLNSYSLNSQSNEKNSPNHVVEKINLCSSTQPHIFHQKGPSTIINSPAGKIPTLPDPQSISYNFFSEIEALKRPYSDLTNTSMERAQSGHGLKDGTSRGHINHILRDNSSWDFPIKSYELSSSFEVSQVNNKVSDHAVSLDKRSCIPDICKTGSSFELKQCGQSLDVARTVGISIAGTSSLGTACSGGNKTEQFQNSNTEVNTDSPHGNGITSHMKVRDQNGGDQDIQIMERKEGSNTVNHSIGKEVSVENTDNPTHVLAGHEHGDNSQHAFPNLDGKSKSHAAKVTPIVEKLWDGSLQLNASVTVSAVAFFKSGEKAPDVTWSRSVGVKGKVRLEAFEKFIQELPRSRSRGLMVTSLCWKVGSSETGLAGMKEVAKGYKKGQRVGFAQLSPGIDLYVCPRSDIIITILAKYGFFKGMAAIEDDQDSLIGCVVWRRNHSSSDPVAKKSERKILPLPEQPLNSTSDPDIPQTAKDNTPITHPGGGSSPLVSENCSTPVDIPGSKGTESKNIQSVEGQNERTPLVPHSSAAISMGLVSAIHSDSCSLHNHMNPEVVTPIMRSLACDKTDSGLGLQKPVIPVSPPTLKSQSRPGDGDGDGDGDDDDDLPEFDFGTAYGVSQHLVGKPPFSSNNAHVSDVQFGNKLPAEGAKDVGDFMPSTLPAVRPMETNSQQRSQSMKVPVVSGNNQASNNLQFFVEGETKNVGELMATTLPAGQPMTIGSQQRSQAMTFPVVSGANQPSIPAKNIGEGESGRPVLSFLDEKTMAHGSELSGQSGKPICSMALPRPKNLWDDDDMPEWCPPDLEHRNQPPTMATTTPSMSCISSTAPSPKSENRPPGPPPLLPLPPPPPPPPLSTHPQFHNQRLPHNYQSTITISVKPAQIRPIGGHARIGPRSSMGFTSNSTLRPQGNMFDVRPPIGWRGWRP